MGGLEITPPCERTPPTRRHARRAGRRLMLHPRLRQLAHHQRRNRQGYFRDCDRSVCGEGDPVWVCGTEYTLCELRSYLGRLPQGLQSI